MKDYTTRLLEALKEEHQIVIEMFAAESYVLHGHSDPGVCETCQLIAEVEAELKGGEDE